VYFVPDYSSSGKPCFLVQQFNEQVVQFTKDLDAGDWTKRTNRAKLAELRVSDRLKGYDYMMDPHSNFRPKRDRDFWKDSVAPNGWKYFDEHLIDYLDKC
jgi:hypothetical protein